VTQNTLDVRARLLAHDGRHHAHLNSHPHLLKTSHLKKLVLRMNWTVNPLPASKPLSHSSFSASAQYFLSNPFQLAVSPDKALNSFFFPAVSKTRPHLVANEGKGKVGAFYFILTIAPAPSRSPRTRSISTRSIASIARKRLDSDWLPMATPK